MRLGVLVAMVGAMILIMRTPAVADALTLERIQLLRQDLGWMAGPSYVLGMGVLIGLWVPGAILLAVGPPMFGTGGAMVLNYLAAVVGAVTGFLIARHVTGDAVVTILQRRVPGWDRYRRRIEARSFETILYLRLVPTPFAAVSYLAGLTPITFGQHLLATAAGILPGSLALTFLSGVIWEAVLAGDWWQLASPRTLLAVAIFLPVLALPRLARHAREAWGWFGGPVEPVPANLDDGPTSG
jgi:uncharacterized membrane protein YdjX (TVP38/TMEM64 family)